MHYNLIDGEISIFQPFLFTFVKSSPHVLFLQFFKLPVSGETMLGFIHLFLEMVTLISVSRLCHIPDHPSLSIYQSSLFTGCESEDGGMRWSVMEIVTDGSVTVEDKGAVSTKLLKSCSSQEGKKKL